MMRGEDGDTIGGALTRLSAMDKNKFLQNRDRVVGEAQARMTGSDVIRHMRTIRDKTMEAMGTTNAEDYYSTKLHLANQYRYMLSDKNLADQLVSESRVIEQKFRKRYTEAETAGRFHNKIFRNIGIFKEELLDMDIFDDIAEFSDRSAAAASGGIYRQAAASTAWMTEANRKRFMESKQVQTQGRSFKRTGGGVFGGSLNPAMDDMREAMRSRTGMGAGGRTRSGTFSEDKFQAGFSRLSGVFSNLKGRSALDDSKIGSSQIKENRSLLSGLMSDGVLDMGKIAAYEGETSLEDIMQFGREYGSGSQKVAIQKFLQGDRQSQANFSSEQLNRFKGEYETAAGMLGEDAVKGISNLRGAGIYGKDLRDALASGSTEKVEKLLKATGSDEGKLRSTIKMLKSSMGAGDFKNVSIEKLLQRQDVKASLVGADRYSGEQARQGSTAASLARQFMFTGDFESFGSDDEIMQLKGIKKQINDLNIDEKTMRQELKKARVASFDDPGNALKAIAVNTGELVRMYKGDSSPNTDKIHPSVDMSAKSRSGRMR
jgi:hypothetical protein